MPGTRRGPTPAPRPPFRSRLDLGMAPPCSEAPAPRAGCRERPGLSHALPARFLRRWTPFPRAGGGAGGPAAQKAPGRRGRCHGGGAAAGPAPAARPAPAALGRRRLRGPSGQV